MKVEISHFKRLCIPPYVTPRRIIVGAGGEGGESY